MDNFITYLNAIRPMSEPLADHFRSILKIRKVKKKAFLVRAGPINNNFFFISKGLVRSYYEKQGKNKQIVEVSLWFLKENDIIASIESYMTQRPGRETMQAIEDCTVAYGSFKDLANTYRLFPEFEHHGRIVTQKYSSLWYTLLYGIRMRTARERYEFLLERFPELLLRVPAKFLASYLSIGEITLSRIKSRLSFS